MFTFLPHLLLQEKLMNKVVLNGTRVRERKIKRQWERLTDIHTEWQTDEETEWHTEGQKKRQRATDRETEKENGKTEKNVKYIEKKKKNEIEMQLLRSYDAFESTL